VCASVDGLGADEDRYFCLFCFLERGRKCFGIMEWDVSKSGCCKEYCFYFLFDVVVDDSGVDVRVDVNEGDRSAKGAQIC